MKLKMKKSGIIRLLVIAVLGLILGFNVYSMNASTLIGNKLPMPFGIGMATVLSGSMEPELSVGDLIVVKKQETYKENDVVVYQDGNMLVVHRIIDIEEETMTTKGDANNTNDQPVSLELVKGSVVLSVPFIGSVVNLIKTPLGTICIIALAILLVEIPRRNEMKKDEEERQKILDEIKRLKDEL